MELYEAHSQWAQRPDDERFETLGAMQLATKEHADSARVSTVDVGQLRADVIDGDVRLIGKTETPAKLTHYSFGQLSRYAGAPAAYLRELPATLAAQNLNHGLKARVQTDKAQLLLHKNGSLVARAITSDSYDRVWNYEVIDALGKRLTPAGWQVPPARPARKDQKGTRVATEADILPNQGDFGLRVKVGDPIAPAGLYASDHDMFAFLVNTRDQINDGAKLLSRGVFIQNSEVGDCSLRLKTFTLDHVCGNHIVWGASNVTEVSVRHVKGELSHRGRTLGKAFAKWSLLSRQLPSAGELETQIKAAKAKEIGATKEEVLDALFSFARARGLQALSRSALEAGYDVAERTPRYGSPRSVWGVVNGLTEYSQTTPFADERTTLDVQAGRIMEMAF